MATMVSAITDTFNTINLQSREMTPKCIARKKSKPTKHYKEHSLRCTRKTKKAVTVAKKNDQSQHFHGYDADDMTCSSSSEDKCALSASLSSPCSSLEVPPAHVTFNFPAIEWASDSQHRQEDGFAIPTHEEEDLYQLLRNQSSSFSRPRRSSIGTSPAPSGGKGSLVRSLAFLKELCELSNAAPAPGTDPNVLETSFW